jgi:glycerophosphoryl diester phosphodiesterase
VLTLLEQTSIWINIELKNNIIVYPHIEEQVVKLVEYFGLENRVILSSFNHYSLRHLHLYRPTWQLAALYETGLFEPWVYAKYLGVSAIHPFYLAATDEVIVGCHEHGIAVRPYTVDDPCTMARLIQAEADAIMTNVPDLLCGLLTESELQSAE